MSCKYCEIFKKTHKKDEEGMYILDDTGNVKFGMEEPRCAFEGEIFSPDNWACQTLSLLREASNDEINEKAWGKYWRSDDIGTISIIPVPDEVDDYGGFIILVYYKDRGKVNNAIRITDDFVEPLRKTLAEKMVDWLLREGFLEAIK